MADELSLLRASLAEKGGTALPPVVRGRNVIASARALSRPTRIALLAVLAVGGAAAAMACVHPTGIRFGRAAVHVCPEDPLWQPL